jgi:hypothetical protein
MTTVTQAQGSVSVRENHRKPLRVPLVTGLAPLKQQHCPYVRMRPVQAADTGLAVTGW